MTSPWVFSPGVVDKIRYTFQADFGSNKMEPSFVLADPPDLTNNSLTTIYVSEEVTDFKDLYALLAAFYDFGANLFRKFETDTIPNLLYEIKPRLGSGLLHEHDGVGNQTKSWTFMGLWPHSVNFGDLCYSSDLTVHIEVTWRFQDCHEDQHERVDTILH